LLRNKQVFVYDIRYLYKIIHLHLDRQRFDWTKQTNWKKTAFVRQVFRIESIGAVRFVTNVLFYRVLKGLGLVAVKNIEN